MAAPAIPKNNSDDPRMNMEKPGYFSYRPDGVFIDLQKSYSAGSFMDFVNKLFAADSRFLSLDYDIFLKLLYDADWLEKAIHNKTPEIRVASAIVHFPPNRRELYKPVKVLDRGQQAEYVFEPVNITVTYDEPVYGEPGADGIAPVISQTRKTMQQPAKLDFDEFVTAMWGKGVKYGIKAAEVWKAISAGTHARMIVASYLPPTEGSDAYMQEVCPDLHRDNSPKTLLNGKADLRAFKNRFPQLTKGTRLLKKIPRVFGKHGYKVTGERIDPPDPQELNLLALVSHGTEIVNDNGFDYIVAQMDGFLTIDPVLNLISINEKIETTAGVSIKTTGDLTLGVEEFIEHGEVQEGRVVKGKHMTFKSNVFGHLQSSGGNIIVHGNLTGGSAETSGGNITLGRASRAVIRAPDGEIKIKYCENCTVLGKSIQVEQAVNSELIGHEVHAESVMGCMIASNTVKIATSTESKNRETLITMMVPDLSAFELNIATIQAKIADCVANTVPRQQELEQLKSNQDFAKFLALYERIKSGAIKLTTEQAGNWQALMTKNSAAFNQAENLNRQILALEQTRCETEQELAKVIHARDSLGGDIHCTIETVTGLTTGQSMKSADGVEIFRDMQPNDIKALLQKVDSGKVRIFSEDDGSIDWDYRKSLNK